jgi:hypothetical protein
MDLVKFMEQHTKVFISSETDLPTEFEPYKLHIPLHKIHDALYYSLMYIGEGATMASEAAVLGTHTLYLSELTAGTTLEQENKYQLLFNISTKDQRLEKTKEIVQKLLCNQNLFELGKEKRKKLLEEKINISAWYIDFILSNAIKQPRIHA